MVDGADSAANVIKYDTAECLGIGAEEALGHSESRLPTAIGIAYQWLPSLPVPVSITGITWGWLIEESESDSRRSRSLHPIPRHRSL